MYCIFILYESVLSSAEDVSSNKKLRYSFECYISQQKTGLDLKFKRWFLLCGILLNVTELGEEIDFISFNIFIIEGRLNSTEHSQKDIKAMTFYE